MPACGIWTTEAAKGRSRTSGNCEKCFKNVGGREFPAAGTRLPPERLRLDDGDDLVGAWIDDHDLLTNQNVVVTTPLRINHEDLLRERVHVHA